MQYKQEKTLQENRDDKLFHTCTTFDQNADVELHFFYKPQWLKTAPQRSAIFRAVAYFSAMHEENTSVSA